MKTISQYREDIKTLMKKAGDIDAKCISENRDPNETEISVKKEIFDMVDDFRNIVEMQERQERTRELLEKPANAPETRPKPAEQRQESRDKKDRFASPGEFWVAVRRAGTPGESVDPRLRNVRAASGLSETVPSDGGLR